MAVATQVGSPTRNGSAANVSSGTLTSTSSTLTGDICVWWVIMRGSTNNRVVSTDAGLHTSPGANTLGTEDWSFALANTTGGALHVVSKVATSDGAQSVPITFKGSGADPNAVVSTIYDWNCYVLRTQKTSAPLILLATPAAATSNPITFPSVTTTESAMPVIRGLGGQQTTGTNDQKSPTWDAAVGSIITAQGTSGSGTGFTYVTTSLETGPTPAGSIGTRSLTLQNTPSTYSRMTIGVLAASGAPPSAPANTALPTITDDGLPETGEVITSSTGTWDNSPTSYAYQWKRNGSNISGATSSSYTLVSADEAQSVTVTVTATNAGGSTSATSAAITPTAPPPSAAPTNTVAPTITTDGTPEVGETVSVNPGTWTGSPTYTYQWLRSGAAISGATSSTYTLAALDVGTNKVACSVTATNSGGSLTVNTASISPVLTGAALRTVVRYRYT